MAMKSHSSESNLTTITKNLISIGAQSFSVVPEGVHPMPPPLPGRVYSVDFSPFHSQKLLRPQNGGFETPLGSQP